jgi:hypothetical protein
METSPAAGLHELSLQECVALLATATVGHLAVTCGALPLVVPVRIHLVRNELAIESLLGSAIPLSAGSVAALETSLIGEGSLMMWTVEVRGFLTTQRVEARVTPLNLSAVDGLGFRLSTQEVSGWSTTLPDGDGLRRRVLTACTAERA